MTARLRPLLLGILLVCGWVSLPHAATGTLMPSPFLVVQDVNGKPINNAKVCVFTAGTTTPATTYTDVALTVPNTNPIRTDSAGRFVAFLTPGASYKVVYQDSTGTAGTCDGATLKTVDNLGAVPTSSLSVDMTGIAGEAIAAGAAAYLSDGSGGQTPGQWYKADVANAYSNTTPIVGIATAAIGAATSGTIRLTGSVTGLVGLTIGARYFVGSAGALSSTLPNGNRYLGVADTTTSLVLAANPPASIQTWVDDFRVTLTSGTPVTTTDVTAATTIYFSPITGNRIDLPDSAGNPQRHTTSELSIAVPATTSQMYDLFVYSNSGTPTLELLAWTNDTTRATAVVRTTNGRWLKSGDNTRLYVASCRTTGVAGQTEDSALKRYVWNYYNRKPRPLVRTESTASWTYNGSIRQANGSTSNQVEAVVGVAEIAIDLFLQAAVQSSIASTFQSVGIGEDSTSTYTVGTVSNQSVSGTGFQNLACRLSKMPAIGRHFYSWNEFSSSSVTTWIGASASGGGTITAGLIGWIEG